MRDISRQRYLMTVSMIDLGNGSVIGVSASWKGWLPYRFLLFCNVHTHLHTFMLQHIMYTHLILQCNSSAYARENK